MGKDDKDGKKGGETNSNTKETTMSLVHFCDANGVNSVDRNAVYMKYGKTTQKTEAEWSDLLKNKITLKQ